MAEHTTAELLAHINHTRLFDTLKQGMWHCVATCASLLAGMLEEIRDGVRASLVLTGFDPHCATGPAQ